MNVFQRVLTMAEQTQIGAYYSYGDGDHHSDLSTWVLS